jgi:cysteinyl-tRNA synthetase
MSLEYLGEQLDIHGGGQDLVFPHHENEIAQSECYTGAKPFSRYWMHNGLLQLGSDKMSKSLGNLVSVVEALERYSPDAIRLYFLSSHYRSPLAYSDEGAAAVERSVERVRRALISGNGSGPEVEADTHRARFTAAMDDDLNTPQALAALFDLARDINRGRDAGQSIGPGQAALREMGRVLGLTFVDRPPPEADLAAAPFIDLLVSVRTELRAARQFALADQIRDALAEQGVTLEDGPQGTQWQRQMTG